ncbi:MAG TPA: short-chain dehydrogenase, partial [Actinomycetota bacterium]|nr:short-chain dehydrogenase [Actinomycetota bacterium]
GVRVVWLQTTGLPESLADDVYPSYGTGSEMNRSELLAWMQRSTQLHRLASLAEVGTMAAFVASDHAAALTATGVNLTCGHVPAR